MDKIPVIDISKIIKDPENKNHWLDIADEVDKACHGIGFFYVVNHGIPKETITSAFEESKKFFELPTERKDEFSIRLATKYRGYTRAGQEILQPGTSFEFREAFAIVGVESPQEFPEEVPKFKEALLKLETEYNSLSRKLLKIFGIALGITDEDYFVKSNLGLTDLGIPNRITLRAQWYPPLGKDIEIPPNSVRCSEHVDYGICTLLAQDSIGGLEVKNANGDWVRATPIPDSIVINLGNAMEVWTGGYYKATPHRVLIPEQEISKRTSRQSIAYFVHTDDDYLITPFETTKNIDCGNKFEVFNMLEDLDRRLGATYQY